MQYQSTGRPLSAAGIAESCDALGAPPAAVWAVVSVETRGFGFLADRRPAILFERHIFHRFTGGRFDLVRPDLSNPVPGGYVGGAGEYPRLQAASTLDRAAAVWSTSWGIGQVMGFNHEVAGFSTVDAMIAAMIEDEDRQLAAMSSFIAASHLDAALAAGDWAAFARGYNGADYRQDAYDTRLAAAFARCAGALPDLDVRAAQAALLYLGFDPGPIDGMVGPRTRAAVVALERRRQLPVTGDLTAELIDDLVGWAWP